MKVYSVNLDLEKTEIKSDLGIQILFNEKRYTLNVNNIGELIFASLDDVQLVVYPKAANCIELKSVDK
jgi:hypothetical protein